jgi:integrase
MPRKSRALIATDREVAGARRPVDGKGRAEYRVAGCPGLVLRVTSEGRRSWVLWLKRAKTGRWQKLTLGFYPAISLSRAREEASRFRLKIRDGEDPFDARDLSRQGLSFKVLGETYVTRYAKPKKRSWAEDERKLKVNVYPLLGACRADLVTKLDIVRLVDAIHDRGAPILANRTLGLIRKLYNFAVADGYVETNPARGIPMRSKEFSRTRTLSEEEIRAFWQALDGPGFEDVTADALRLQLLLGARIREVTSMERSELALECTDPVWTLPAHKAKGGRDVPRPVLPTALDILRRRIEAIGRSRFVFASPYDSSQPIIPQAPTRAVKRAADRGLVPAGFTPHDLRRTARTYWAMLGIEPTLAKKILGHAPPKSDVDATVYDQYTYAGEMRRALGRWEERLLAIVTQSAQPLGAAA